MDRRSSLNGRLSLSTSNLTNPIAESTHISGLQQKFPWGGIHSPAKNIDSAKHSRNHNDSVIKSNLNNTLQRLDPRIYTDVQSQGLTSRIVKYYENSMKLNRSSSFNNLYNKPGQFPVVHLKKNEIPYKPNKNKSVSMVRIAPPDKSVFQANSRSSILRTGSVVPTISLGLKQTNTDIARENRPILHPAVENESAPTRSVLEALKEISRKRINSDELDCNDSIKKYCKETNADSSFNLTAALSSLITSTNSSNFTNVQTYKNNGKRYRDLTSPSVSPTPKIPNNRQNNNINVKPRRINNEFTSSISSSLSLLSPKRKYSEQFNSSRTFSPTSDEISPSNEQPKQKQRLDVLNNNAERKVLHIKNAKQLSYLTPTMPAANVLTNSSNLVTTAEPTRTVSEPIIKSNYHSLESKNNKPKLTLFNKNYGLSDNGAAKKPFVEKLDDSEISKIPFIKPKNNYTSNGITKNAMMERAQKTKLALMLSGLRGDLNEDQDEIDGIKEIENSQNNDIKIVDSKVEPFVTQNTSKDKTDSSSKQTEENLAKLVPPKETKLESAKAIGGFKFPLAEPNKDLKQDSIASKPSGFTFGKIENGTTITVQPSQNSSVLPFNSVINTTPTLNNTLETISKNTIENQIKNTSDKITFSTSSSISSNTTLNNVRFSDNINPSMTSMVNTGSIQPGNTFGSKSSNLTNPPIAINTSMQQNKSNKSEPTNSKLMFESVPKNEQIQTTIASVISEGTFGGNSVVEKRNEEITPNSLMSNNFAFSSSNAAYSNKKDNTNVNDQSNIQTGSNINKSGGFAFGNSSAALENNSNVFQFPKPNNVQSTISSNTTKLVSVNPKTENTFLGLNNKPQTVSSPSSSIQQNSTFSFGGNQANENSNIFTSSNIEQPTSKFSFTSTNNSTSPMFGFGNVSSNENNNQIQSKENVVSHINFNSNGQNNKVATNQPPTIFGTTDSVKTAPLFNTNTTNSHNQNHNSFQFATANNPTNQNSFSFKSPDVSKDKPNSVFGSNSFNSPTSNVSNNTFLFGNNASAPSTKSVFGNNTNIADNQTSEQESKATPIFGSTGGTLLKSASAFSFSNNNNVVTNANSNSTVSTGVFSFNGSSIQNNPQLNGAKSSAATFDFGSNNTMSNTFTDNKTDVKSNTFGVTTSNSMSNIFGNNIASTGPSSFGINNQNINTNSFGNNNTNSFNTNNSNNNRNTFNSNANDGTSGKFSFANTTNNTNSTRSKNTGGFPFGGSDNITNTSTNNVFSFGGNNPVSTSTVDNKPPAFNFPGNVGTNNLFGGVNGNNNNGNSSNLFNPGSHDRPIRKATRRLNK